MNTCVLIVDDHAPYVAMLRTLLYPCSVEHVATVSAAQKRLLRKPFCPVLIVDEDIHGQSGASLVQWLQSRTERPYIVAHSLHPQEQVEQAYMQSNVSFDIFIAKPIGARMLAEQIQEILRHYDTRD